MHKTGPIYGINGPVIYLKATQDFRWLKWSTSEKNVW